MTVVDVWTGKHANALRTALRLTNEAFAEQLGTAVRTVAKWNADPELVPVPEMQRALDTLLGRATEEAKARFDLVVDAWRQAPANTAAGPLETTSSDEALIDPQIQAITDWLDACAGWAAGTGAVAPAHCVRTVSR